jgi:Cyclin, N-terminal domain
MPTTRSGRFYNNGHGGNHEISRPSGGRQRLDRRATSSFAAAAADLKEERRAHTLKRTADSNHGYSNSTLDCDDTEIHNRSSHTTASSNQRKNSPRKKARVATTGSALRLSLDSEQETTAGTIPILSTGPTNQADVDAPTKTAVASNVRAPPLAPSVNVATVTPGILPAAAFYSTPAAALPLQTSSALSTEESNPRQRTKVLPDGVVPIFQLDEYSSSNNAAMSRLLLSAEPSDSHSTTTALGFATPTTTTPAIATSSRQPPAPHMARSTVTTNNAAPAQQVWSVWCSLVHMHVTVYGADYWRALVSRERLEAAATANWSNHDASSSSTNSEALTAPTWDEPPSDKEDDATSNPDTNLPSTQDSNNTTATFASPRRQHPSRTAAASAAAAGDDSLASSTTSNDSPSSSSDSGYDLPVVDDSQSSARLPHQPLLTVKMRRVLVLWLSEVVQEYKLSEAAYHLSVTLLDSVLARGPSDYRSEQHGILEAALAPESEQGNEWLVRPRDFQALGW